MIWPGWFCGFQSHFCTHWLFSTSSQWNDVWNLISLWSQKKKIQQKSNKYFWMIWQAHTCAYINIPEDNRLNRQCHLLSAHHLNKSSGRLHDPEECVQLYHDHGWRQMTTTEENQTKRHHASYGSGMMMPVYGGDFNGFLLFMAGFFTQAFTQKHFRWWTMKWLRLAVVWVQEVLLSYLPLTIPYTGDEKAVLLRSDGWPRFTLHKLASYLHVMMLARLS